MKHISTLAICLFLLTNCANDQNRRTDKKFEDAIRQKLDQSITVYEPYAVVKLPLKTGQEVWNPGVIAQRDDGSIYVANLTGEIYSLRDSDEDGLEDKTLLFCDVKDEGFRTPSSMVFKGDDLYVGLPQQIRVYRDLDNDHVADTSFVFFDKIPFSDHPYEYTTGLRFDKDGWLHFALATDSWNAGASPDPLKYRGSIIKISPDGEEVKVVATGIRSVFGMDFNKDGKLFFSDNQGGQNNVEELHILKEGSFYGHNTQKFAGLEAKNSMAMLDYEVAPAQMQFSSSDGTEHLYVGYYGPGEYWNRGAVTKVEYEFINEDSLELTEKPIADIPKVAGLIVAGNGDIYVTSVGETDYWYFATNENEGSIYRLIKQDWVTPETYEGRGSKSPVIAASSIEKGRFVFHERACASCHSIDGQSQMLGPDLKNITTAYSKEEIIDEIKYPSKRLKSGDFPTKITTKDDEVFLGRVITQDEEEVKIILVGNIVKSIAASNIKSSEQVTQSLMYEGLLEGLEQDEVDGLIDFLASLQG